MAEAGPEEFKLLLVGDQARMTDIMLLVCMGEIPEYVPCLWGPWTVDVKVHNTLYRVDISVSSHLEEYAQLRRTSYEGKHVVALVYSVMSPDSYQKCQSELVPEVRSSCIPFIIVGNETHKRNDPAVLEKLNNASALTHEQGVQLARESGASSYVECSTVSQEGIMSIFESAVKAVLANQPKQPWYKRIMKF